MSIHITVHETKSMRLITSVFRPNTGQTDRDVIRSLEHGFGCKAKKIHAPGEYCGTIAECTQGYTFALPRLEDRTQD